MGTLDDILTAWTKVKADIALGTAEGYLQAYEDTLDAQRAFIEFAKSVAFKAGPDDAKVQDEIEKTIKDCADMCKADKKKAAVGSFDWKGLLSQLLLAFLSWWSTRPVLPAPTP